MTNIKAQYGEKQRAGARSLLEVGRTVKLHGRIQDTGPSMGLYCCVCLSVYYLRSAGQSGCMEG